MKKALAALLAATFMVGVVSSSFAAPDKDKKPAKTTKAGAAKMATKKAAGKKVTKKAAAKKATTTKMDKKKAK